MLVLKEIAELAVAALQAAGVPGEIVRGRIPPVSDDVDQFTLVYCHKDVGTAAGSPRVPQTEMFRTSTLTFAYWTRGNSGTELEDALAAHGELIVQATLESSSFISNFEGCTSLNIDFVLSEGDSHVGQLIIEMNLLHGTRFVPQITDDFTTLAVNREDGDPQPSSEINPPQN